MKRSLVFLLFLLIIPATQAQKEDVLDQIIIDFNTYSALPREVVYVHLNKSVYIKGEDVGFKAYVLDKDHKSPSLETRNLYCVLADSTGREVKSSLVRIQNGVGHGLMELDSLFVSGQYTFRAYTNWMRNFSETNHFEQPLDVLDPETDTFVPVTENAPGVDVQVLPEGGHAVAGIPSVYGIIIKDATGFGIPEVEGTVTDAQGKEVTRFKVNQFGIGRLQLTPSQGAQYKVRFRHMGREVSTAIPPPEPEGIALQVSDLRDQVGLTLRARFEDPSRTGAPYFLTFHNGDSIKGLPVDLSPAGEVLKIIPDRDLFPGMNVFTLFDPAGEPLVERLYFNEDGLTFHRGLSSYTQQKGDSLQIRLGIPGLDPNRFHSLSVSVLPMGTKAVLGHHSLPSYTLLQPYVKGPIQNASYYFREVTARKRYELDNLLLTQGWSSYNWETLRNRPPQYLFDFEKGLSYTVHLNSRKSDSFYIFPTQNNTSQLLKLSGDGDSFTVEEFYPVKGEKLAITEIRGNQKSVPSGAFIQFKPSAIPPWKGLRAPLLPSRLGQTLGEIEVPPISFENLERLQMLDEVVVTKMQRRERLEKIRDRSMGRVDVFKEDDPRRLQFLSNYLSGRGYIVNEDQTGGVSIVARNPNSPNNARPIIYLDGVMLFDYDILWRFQMNVVDYIEINPSGIGSGIMGGGGVIRIVTDPSMAFQDRAIRKPYRSYSVPLAFEREKRFYSPVYSSYTSEFYEAFGVVDWRPDLRTKDEGGLNLTVKNPSGGNLELHVEGIINGDEFVSTRLPLKIPGS